MFQRTHVTDRPPILDFFKFYFEYIQSCKESTCVLGGFTTFESSNPPPTPVTSPTSPYISLHLPASRSISLHLVASRCISPQELLRRQPEAAAALGASSAAEDEALLEGGDLSPQARLDATRTRTRTRTRTQTQTPNPNPYPKVTLTLTLLTL